MLKRTIWLLLLVAWWRTETANGLCRSAAATVSVEARQNTTGHWHADVGLAQSWPSDRKPGPLKMAVEPVVSTCGSTRTAKVHIRVEGSPPPGSNDYEFVPDVGYYKVHTENKSWVEAKAICENESGHLVIINSEKEANALKSILDRHPSLFPWLHVGFHDMYLHGNYVTIFGESLSSTGYTKWHPGQPDNHLNNEGCGVISKDLIGLGDIYCLTQIPFICEQE